jgi:hypothetical protein
MPHHLENRRQEGMGVDAVTRTKKPFVEMSSPDPELPPSLSSYCKSPEFTGTTCPYNASRLSRYLSIIHGVSMTRINMVTCYVNPAFLITVNLSPRKLKFIFESTPQVVTFYLAFF